MDGQAIKDTLGKNIKIVRARRGLSQADLAEKADISIPFLSNIERGIKYPQPEMLSKITNALGVEVNELFTADPGAGEAGELLNHLTEDIFKNVNLAMSEVFKRYLGRPVPQGTGSRPDGPAGS
ncbi:MAG: helix-turn-helix domain-containing protein [Treponema sp.]|jgi:transcriptional regulator with XRE-family HTH domain|nr:helix-turn-helix domain-containing protein [Treponema sp.]